MIVYSKIHVKDKIGEAPSKVLWWIISSLQCSEHQEIFNIDIRIFRVQTFHLHLVPVL